LKRFFTQKSRGLFSLCKKLFFLAIKCPHPLENALFQRTPETC